MPAFYYFATFDESITILQDLCEKGYRIIAFPDLFEVPEAPTYTAVTKDLQELLRKAPSFYFGGKFSRFPVQFQQLESGPSAGKYAIDLLSEGPLMQSIIARVNDVDGIPTLLPGDTSYQSQYRNPETGEWAKASDDVKAAYREIVSVIKKRCIRHMADIEIYIAPDALKLIERGRARIKYPFAI